MAFGKDDSHLNNIPSFGQGNFGQSSAAASTRPARGGGRGSRFYWADNFEMSENPAVLDMFRLIRGDYPQTMLNAEGNLVQYSLPFVAFREHYHGSSKKGGICSAGPHYLDREKREPCHGCNIYWEDVSERRAKKDAGDSTKGPNRISMTDKYAFTVLDYAYYFEMPQTDAQGRVRNNPRTNQPFMNWEKAYNVNDPRYAGRKWKQGDVRPWSINKTWKETLHSYSTAISNGCVSCGTSACVMSRGWFCGNPACRAFIFDPNNTTASVEQQQTLTRNLHGCPTCQQMNFPHEEVHCNACGPAGKRASIFDVDLFGFRQKGSGDAATQLIIMQFSAPRPIQLADPEVLKTAVPLKLLDRFVPMTLEDQEKAWNIAPAQHQQAHVPPGAGGYAPPPGAIAPQPGQYVAPNVPQHVQPQAAPQVAPVWSPPPGGAQAVPPGAYQAAAPVPQPVDPNSLEAQLAQMNQQGFGHNS